MIRRCFLLAGILLAIGCERQPDYTFSGRLLKPDGSPASGMSVMVTPASAALTGDPKGKVLTTDDGGGFTGTFENDMDGTDWAHLPLASMPPLSGVYLWVYDRYQWKAIPVSVDPLSERQHFPGRQSIILPTVSIPVQRPNRPDTVPSVTTMPTSGPAIN